MPFGSIYVNKTVDAMLSWELKLKGGSRIRVHSNKLVFVNLDYAVFPKQIPNVYWYFIEWNKTCSE